MVLFNYFEENIYIFLSFIRKIYLLSSLGSILNKKPPALRNVLSNPWCFLQRVVNCKSKRVRYNQGKDKELALITKTYNLSEVQKAQDRSGSNMRASATAQSG